MPNEYINNTPSTNDTGSSSESASPPSQTLMPTTTPSHTTTGDPVSYLFNKDLLRTRYSVKTPGLIRTKRPYLTFSDIADACKVTTNTVQNWQKGKTEPKASQLMILSQLFNVKLEDWFVQ